ncbi:uncharacterized protein [Littorina saxatilis]
MAENLPFWFVVGVSVFLGVGIIVIVVVCWCCHSKRRKKKRIERDMNIEAKEPSARHSENEDNGRDNVSSTFFSENEFEMAEVFWKAAARPPDDRYVSWPPCSFSRPSNRPSVSPQCFQTPASRTDTDDTTSKEHPASLRNDTEVTASNEHPARNDTEVTASNEHPAAIYTICHAVVEQRPRETVALQRSASVSDVGNMREGKYTEKGDHNEKDDGAMVTHSLAEAGVSMEDKYGFTVGEQDGYDEAGKSNADMTQTMHRGCGGTTDRDIQARASNRSNGGPREAVGSGRDTATNRGLRPKEPIDVLTWPGTQRKNKNKKNRSTSVSSDPEVPIPMVQKSESAIPEAQDLGKLVQENLFHDSDETMENIYEEIIYSVTRKHDYEEMSDNVEAPPSSEQQDKFTSTTIEDESLYANICIDEDLDEIYCEIIEQDQSSDHLQSSLLNTGRASDVLSQPLNVFNQSFGARSSSSDSSEQSLTESEEDAQASGDVIPGEESSLAQHSPQSPITLMAPAARRRQVGPYTVVDIMDPRDITSDIASTRTRKKNVAKCDSQGMTSDLTPTGTRKENDAECDSRGMTSDLTPTGTGKENDAECDPRGMTSDLSSIGTGKEGVDELEPRGMTSGFTPTGTWKKDDAESVSAGSENVSQSNLLRRNETESRSFKDKCAFFETSTSPANPSPFKQPSLGPKLSTLKTLNISYSVSTAHDAEGLRAESVPDEMANNSGSSASSVNFDEEIYTECASVSVANISPLTVSDGSSDSDDEVRFADGQVEGSSEYDGQLVVGNPLYLLLDDVEEWFPQRSSTLRRKKPASQSGLLCERARHFHDEDNEEEEEEEEEDEEEEEEGGQQQQREDGEAEDDEKRAITQSIFTENLYKEEMKDLYVNLMDTYITSSWTQTSPKEDEKPPRPCFSADWQISKEFSSMGGSLQKEASDVRLEIPAEAVPVSTFVTIKGAISVDIAQVYRKLELCEREYVVSPIAEYNVSRGFVFQCQVQIFLPNFLPQGFRPESVNLYRFNCDHFGNFSYEKLPLRGKDNLDESHDYQNMPPSNCFYFGNDGQICILTSHFSGYVCTYCRGEFPACDLHVEVYAKHEEKDRGGRQAKVRLEIWDSRLFIKDFRESQNAIRNQREPGLNHNMVLMDRKTLAALAPSTDVKDMYVGTRLDVFSEGETCQWEHKLRPLGGDLCFPVQSTMELKRFVPCPCQSHIPEVVDWLLTNINRSDACAIISDVFECLVDVGYVTSADRKAEDQMKFLLDPRKITIHVSVSKTMNTHLTTNDASDMDRFGQLAFPETYSRTIKNDLSKVNNNHNKPPTAPKPPLGKRHTFRTCPQMQREAFGELQSKACTGLEHLHTSNQQTGVSGQFTGETTELKKLGKIDGSFSEETAAKYVSPIQESCPKGGDSPQNAGHFNRSEQPAAKCMLAHCCGIHNTHGTLQPHISAVNGGSHTDQHPLKENQSMEQAPEKILQTSRCANTEQHPLKENHVPERISPTCRYQIAGRATEDQHLRPPPDGIPPPVMQIVCHRMDNVVLNLMSPLEGEFQRKTDPDPEATSVKLPAESARSSLNGFQSSASCSSPVQCQDEPCPGTSVSDKLESHVTVSSC